MTDFKTPRTFIFSNAVTVYVDDPLGTPTTIVTPIGTAPLDPLREYLGLTAAVYREGLPDDMGSKGSEFDHYGQLPPSINYTKYLNTINYGAGAVQIANDTDDNPNYTNLSTLEQQKIETQIINSFEAISVRLKASIGSPYEDFNFRFPTLNRPTISTRTILWDLNEYDIRENNEDIPAGFKSLSSTKEETSLKFAYAFQTFGLDGSTEIITKEVNVANNFIELFETANNESKFPETIPRLKNIVYGGLTSGDLGEQESVVLGGSGPVKAIGDASDIGIDKLYNVVEIKVPAESAMVPTSKKSFLDYAFSHYKTLGISSANLVGTLALDRIRAINRYTAQSLFSYQLDPKGMDNVPSTSPFLSMVPGSLPVQEGLSSANDPKGGTESTQIPFTYFGLHPYDTVNVIVPPTTALEQPGAQLAHLHNTLGKKQTNVTRLEPYVLQDSSISMQTPWLALWLQGGSKKGFQEYPWLSSAILEGHGELNNFSISNLFTGARKKSKDKDLQPAGADFLFSKQERFNNLFTPPQLIGFKVVKSHQPYDSLTTNLKSSSYKNSIIQTFYINASPDETASTIRIFDSQVIYGEKYFYTLFGIYFVDGKYYYYDDIKMTVEEAVYGSITNFYEAFKEENTDTGDKGGTYANPCCRVRTQIDSLSKSNLNPNGILPYDGSLAYGGQIEISDRRSQFISAMKANSELPPTLVEDITKLLNLHDPKTLSNTPYTKDPWGPSSQTITDLNNVMMGLRESTKCYLCRRVSEYYHQWHNEEAGNKKWRSLIEYFTTFMNSKETNAFYSYLNCDFFGFNKKGGGQPHMWSKAAMAFNTPIAQKPSIDKDGKLKFPFSSGLPELLRCQKWKSKLVGTQAGPLLSPKKLNSFNFKVKELHARRAYDFVLQPSVDTTIINFVPLPPIATFVPLEDTNDKILIKFQTLQDSGPEPWFQRIDGVVNTLNGKRWPQILAKSIKYYEDNKINEKGLPEVVGVADVDGDDAGSIIARAENDVKEIHAFKLDRTPTSRADVVEAGDRYVLNLRKSETAYFSNLKPNQKYYYIFVARDVTGLYSAGTEIYEVEIVEDSGYSYATIKIYEFPKAPTKQATKSFKKLLKIKPSFEETLPEAAASIGSTSLFSTIKYADGGSYGPGTQPLKFKIRIRSKKTKRAIDINLKYTEEIQQVKTKKALKEIKTHSTLIDEHEV